MPSTGCVRISASSQSSSRPGFVSTSWRTFTFPTSWSAAPSRSASSSLVRPAEPAPPRPRRSSRRARRARRARGHRPPSRLQRRRVEPRAVWFPPRGQNPSRRFSRRCESVSRGSPGPESTASLSCPRRSRSSRANGFEVVVERGAGVARRVPGRAVRGRRSAARGLPGCPRRRRGASSASARRTPTRSAPTGAAMVLVGFLQPLTDLDGIARLRERGVVAFAMESIPRITRAQSMDALSSQATVAGYKAVLLAADRSPKLFPMMMTAAGTIAPARVLVLGAGRRRPAGDRDGAASRRGRVGVRRAARGRGAGRVAGRVVPRSRDSRRGDRGRLRDAS